MITISRKFSPTTLTLNTEDDLQLLINVFSRYLQDRRSYVRCFGYGEQSKEEKQVELYLKTLLNI